MYRITIKYKWTDVEKEAYKSTTRVEIIKTKSYSQALDLEQYIIKEISLII